jgi:hypothetical protein
MTFGQFFLIMGIIAICKKQISGAAFTVTGIGCIIIPAINEWGGLFNSNFSSSNIFPIFLSTAITIIGLAMMIVPGVLENMAERRCKVIVEAECVDFKSTIVSGGEMVYSPIYKYTFEGKDYTVCRGKYSKIKNQDIGYKTTLKINQKKPKDVYFEASKASKMLIYIFGISFFIAGIGMLITTLASI